MKTRALAVNAKNKKEKIVTAFDAVCLREFSKPEFDELKFYYMDLSNERYEMTPKFIQGKNTAFFAFKADNIPESYSEDEGESLTHYVAKKALTRLEILHLIDVKANVELQLKVVKGENEKRFELDKPYYADVFFKLDSKQNKDMKKYFYKWGEKLVIEIFVSHKVSAEKSNSFSKYNIPIFEVMISKRTRDKFELENCDKLSKERIEQAINNMQKMFEKGIRGVFISDPETEEYKTMCRYKEEIEKFRSARDEAEREYSDVQQKLIAINKELEMSESKKEYYDNRVADLEREIAYSKKHPIKFILSNIKIKK